jgi:uncharacterized protein
MAGEKDLNRLLAMLTPQLQEGSYVFCVAPTELDLNKVDLIGFFQESEGRTLILKQEEADRLGLAYTFVAAWLTLTVHSALDAVGLTAAFATALAKEGISCNIIAGFYHDHLFVAQADGAKALAVLEALSATAKMSNNG